MEETGSIPALIEAVKEIEKVQVIAEGDGLNSPFVVAVPDGKSLDSLKGYFDDYRHRPERRKGTAKLSTLDAFIAHALRFKDENSALFADQNMSAPRMLSVLDYHEGGPASEALPRFGQHRGEYCFPLSEEWLAWNGTKNRQPFQQAEFAAFIEDRIADVSDPAAAGESVKEFVALLGTSLASPARLMELSRGLTVHVSGKVVNVANLSSGESQFTFTEEHKDSTGQKLTVPGAFVLAIPVFRGGALYQVPARLRYRAKDGAVTWTVQLYRTEKVFQHAFDEAASKAADVTGLPVFYGLPE